MADTALAPLPTESVTVTANKPAAPKPTLGGLTSQLATDVDKGRQDIDANMSSVGKITNDFHSMLGELKSQAPKPPTDKPFQAPEQVNPVSGFGSTAGLLAGIASLFTRAPLTSSLNAMSAGMKAIQEGNAANYQKSFDEWKANTDYAFKAFDAENKSYGQMIDLAQTDYNAAMQGVKQLATMTNDKAAMTALEMKGLEGVEQLQIERQRLNNEAQANAAKMIPATIFNHALKEYKIKNGKEPDAQAMSQLWTQAQMGGLGGSPSGASAAGGAGGGAASLVAHYGMPMPTGFALKSMGGDQFVRAVMMENPDYKAPKYNAINKAYLDFSDGPAGKLITSANVAIQHLTLLREAAHALKNGDIQMLNTARQNWLQQTGSPLPTNFDGIGNIAGDELVKFIVGGGKAGGALGDREKMHETLKRASSEGQLDGQLDSYIGLMAGQVAGQRKRYQENELEEYKPFDQWLIPETQQALSTHGGGGGSKQSGDFSHLWK